MHNNRKIPCEEHIERARNSAIYTILLVDIICRFFCLVDNTVCIYMSFRAKNCITGFTETTFFQLNLKLAQRCSNNN